MPGLAYGLGLRPRSPVGATAMPASISSIDADGWSAQWANGTPPAFAPDSAPTSIAVSRAGFDAAGGAISYHTTGIFTRRKRQVYPNQALDTDATVALDDYVYATDSIAGVGNNSTETSPKPIAAWVMPARLLVGNSVHWEMVAFHRNFRQRRQVAAVRVRANDGTTQTAWQTISATAISTLVEDANPIEVYRGDLDITALATGLFWLEAEVFPWIGTTAAILKTEESHATSTAPREFNRRYFLKNVARAADPPLAYVSSAGVDSTGVWSISAVTAAATPFLTVAGAMTAVNDATRGTPATDGVVDGCRIRIVDTVTLGTVASARPQNVAAVVIERAPNTARANAVVTLATPFRTRIGSTGLSAPLTEGAILFSDVTINRTANTTLIGEAAVNIAFGFRNVVFVSATTGAYLANSHAAHFGTVFTGTTPTLAQSTGGQQRLLRGITADFNTSGPECWVTAGCALTRVGTTSQSDPRMGAIWYANRYLNPSNANACIAIEAVNPGDTITGIAVVQNLIETIGTGGVSSMRLSGDNANGSIVHAVLAHNVFTGVKIAGRCNIFYDEATGTNRRNHRLIRDVGNIYVQLNTKGDVFHSTAAPAEAPNRTGQLAYHHGVGCHGNWSQYRVNSETAFSEDQAYPGLGSNIGTSTETRADPLFVDYRGTGGTGTTPVAGAGGGDYRLQAGSPARGRVTVCGLSFDLSGIARAGAMQAAGSYA